MNKMNRNAVEASRSIMAYLRLTVISIIVCTSNFACDTTKVSSQSKVDEVVPYFKGKESTVFLEPSDPSGLRIFISIMIPS